MKILFASKAEKPEVWLPLLKASLPRDELVVAPAHDVDVALVAMPPDGTFQRIGRPRLIQSLWMGVDKLLADPALPRDVPLARTVDPGMVAAMSEMVLACVLDWHRHLYRYREQQRAATWRHIEQRMAADRTVALLGLGALGTDAARKLAALGFNLTGWSRRPKGIPGVEAFTDLGAALRNADVAVCLLPLTRGTQGILNGKTFAMMKRGACVINLARGGHLVAKDLLAALDGGALSHAYLDVFEREPLPADDPMWRHPAVTVTPHVAALTEPRTALPMVLANIERVRRGEAPQDLVDLEAGY